MIASAAPDVNYKSDGCALHLGEKQEAMVKKAPTFWRFFSVACLVLAPLTFLVGVGVSVAQAIRRAKFGRDSDGELSLGRKMFLCPFTFIFVSLVGIFSPPTSLRMLIVHTPLLSRDIDSACEHFAIDQAVEKFNFIRSIFFQADAKSRAINSFMVRHLPFFASYGKCCEDFLAELASPLFSDFDAIVGRASADLAGKLGDYGLHPNGNKEFVELACERHEVGAAFGEWGLKLLKSEVQKYETDGHAPRGFAAGFSAVIDDILSSRGLAGAAAARLVDVCAKLSGPTIERAFGELAERAAACPTEGSFDFGGPIANLKNLEANEWTRVVRSAAEKDSSMKTFAADAVDAILARNRPESGGNGDAVAAVTERNIADAVRAINTLVTDRCRSGCPEFLCAKSLYDLLRLRAGKAK
jgi:hypothetical protein